MLALLASACSSYHPPSIVARSAILGTDGALVLVGARLSEHTRYEGGASSPATRTPWIGRYSIAGELEWSALLGAGGELDSIAERSDGAMLVSGIRERAMGDRVFAAVIGADGAPIWARDLDVGIASVPSTQVEALGDGAIVALSLPDGLQLVRLDGTGAVLFATGMADLELARLVPGADGAVTIVAHTPRRASALVVTLDSEARVERAYEIMSPAGSLVVVDAAYDPAGALVIAAEGYFHRPYDSDLVIARFAPSGVLEWARGVSRHSPSHEHVAPNALSARFAVAAEGTLWVATGVHRGEHGADLALLELTPEGSVRTQRALDASLAIPLAVRVLGEDMAVAGLDAWGVGHTRWIFGRDRTLGCFSRTWDPALALFEIEILTREASPMLAPFASGSAPVMIETIEPELAPPPTSFCGVR